jgi:anti-sigma factor RsiW
MTVKCDEVRRFADLFIDGEFDDRESALFEEHLAGCLECRSEVNALMAFQEAVRQKLGPAKMPSDIRERVIAQAYRQAQASSGIDWLGWPMRVAAALAVVVIAGLGVYKLVPTQPGEVARFVEESVAEHEAALPLDVGQDTAKSEKLAAEGPDARGRTLPLREDDSTKLVGIRVTRIGKTKAILYRYLHKGREISVVRWPRDNKESEAGETAEYTRVVYEGDRDGHPVRLLESPGYSTTVVGDIPRRDLIRLIPTSL